MSVREVQKVAAEYLRPLNQGFESIGSATNFNHYVETTYIPVVMPGMAKSTQDRYNGVIKNYLIPAFGNLCLRDLSRLTVQRYFSGLANSALAHESKDKIKDVLSSILGSAVQFDLLAKNPVESIRLSHRGLVESEANRTSLPNSSMNSSHAFQSHTRQWSLSRSTLGCG